MKVCHMTSYKDKIEHILGHCQYPEDCWYTETSKRLNSEEWDADIADSRLDKLQVVELLKLLDEHTNSVLEGLLAEMPETKTEIKTWLDRDIYDEGFYQATKQFKSIIRKAIDE